MAEEKDTKTAKKATASKAAAAKSTKTSTAKAKTDSQAAAKPKASAKASTAAKPKASESKAAPKAKTAKAKPAAKAQGAEQKSAVLRAHNRAPKSRGKAPKRERKTLKGQVLVVKQVGSPLRRQAQQKATLVGLGLDKLGKTSILPDTAATRGMITKVRHMVEIVEERSA